MSTFAKDVNALNLFSVKPIYLIVLKIVLIKVYPFNVSIINIYQTITRYQYIFNIKFATVIDHILNITQELFIV